MAHDGSGMLSVPVGRSIEDPSTNIAEAMKFGGAKVVFEAVQSFACACE